MGWEIMKLTFENPGYAYMLQSILEFQGDNQGEFFREALYKFYPNFNKEKMDSLDTRGKKEYIDSVTKDIYEEKKKLLEEKVIAYQKHWDENKEIIQQAFEEIFNMNLDNEFNSMKGNISLNPICPRYLNTNTFDIFYLNSERGALGLALHEITHFIWFKKWQEIFKDNPEEYEYPSLKWIFSEMVVESILSDERLKALNPYTGENVYEYFYKLKLDGELVLDILDKLYKENSIKDFMERGFEFCKAQEALIRSVMY